MKNLFRERFRERILDTMDWVDIRPDPHWTSFALAPAVLALCLYFIPGGFLPLFLVLCAIAAVASLVLVVVGIVGTVAWRATRDVVEDRLAALRRWRTQGQPLVITRRSPEPLR
jgi:hypothetical protein